MGLSTLSVRDSAQFMFQFSKTLTRVVLVKVRACEIEAPCGLTILGLDSLTLSHP